jgi:hypothetical protein
MAILETHDKSLAITEEMKDDEAVLDVLNSNDGLPLKPLEQAKAPAPETKTETKEIDWSHFGPLLRDTLTTVLRHFKREGDGVITHIDILNARQLIKDINSGGN